MVLPIIIKSLGHRPTESHNTCYVSCKLPYMLTCADGADCAGCAGCSEGGNGP